MKMRGECISCLMRRILMEINEVDPSKEMEVMEACTIKLGEEFRDGVVSAECATKIHGLAYELLGTDPYIRLKQKSNEQALALFPRAKDFVGNSQDPFRAAVLCAIIGNVLDYGIHKELDKPDFLLKSFERLLAIGCVKLCRWRPTHRYESVVRRISCWKPGRRMNWRRWSRFSGIYRRHSMSWVWDRTS